MNNYQGMARGTKFDLVDPTVAMINPEEFRFHLQRLYRFNGGIHCTVWTHSLNAWQLAFNLCQSVEVRRMAFIHDFHEAVIGDITRPMLVQFPMGGAWYDLREKIDKLVYERLWGVVPASSEPVRSMVKTIDNMLLYKEAEIWGFPHVLAKEDVWPEGCKYIIPRFDDELFVDMLDDLKPNWS